MSLRRTDFPQCCGAEILSRFGFCMGQDERPTEEAQERQLQAFLRPWGTPVKVAILTKTQAERWGPRLRKHRFERVTAWMQGGHSTRFAIFVRHNNPRVDPKRKETDNGEE